MSKLREKLKKEGFSNVDYLDQIADDFAIKFANWLMMYSEKTIYINQYIYKNKEMHITELLQIFKDKYYEIPI